jgi:type I restriction enzyme, S subunit
MTESWRNSKFGDVVESTALGGVYIGQGKPTDTALLKMGAMARGRIVASALEFVPECTAVDPKHLLHEGDVLLNTRNTLALVGKVAIWRGEAERAVFDNNVMRLAFDRQQITSNEFANLLLNSGPVLRQLRRRAIGTTSVAAIYWRDLQRMPIVVPPRQVQSDAVKLDTAVRLFLNSLSAIIDAKVNFRRGLTPQLLSGRKRFPGFQGKKWQSVTLGELARYTPRKTPKPSGQFLSAGVRSHGKGVFLKKEFESAGIALEELFELKHKDLVVNITFGWEGALAIVPPEADGALVSHRFPTYVVDEGKILVEYLRHMIRSKRFVFDVGVASPGGAGRNRVLNRSEFLQITLRIPCIDEQRRIAEVLNWCDRELELLVALRKQIESQKHALLSKLLSGDFPSHA